jgi:hypothetical protein
MRLLAIATISCLGLVTTPASADPAPAPNKKLSLRQRAAVWAAPVRVRSYDQPGAFSVTRYGIDNGRRIVKSKFRQFENGNQVTVKYGAVVANNKTFKRIQTTLRKPDGTTLTSLRIPGLMRPQRSRSTSRYRKKTLLGQRARAVAESPLPYFAVATLVTGGALSSAAAGKVIILGAGGYLLSALARMSREMLKPSKQNLNSF